MATTFLVAVMKCNRKACLLGKDYDLMERSNNCEKKLCLTLYLAKKSNDNVDYNNNNYYIL